MRAHSAGASSPAGMVSRRDRDTMLAEKGQSQSHWLSFDFDVGRRHHLAKVVQPVTQGGTSRRHPNMKHLGDLVEGTRLVVAPDDDLALTQGQTRNRLRERGEDPVQGQLMIPLPRRIYRRVE